MKRTATILALAFLATAATDVFAQGRGGGFGGGRGGGRGGGAGRGGFGGGPGGFGRDGGPGAMIRPSWVMSPKAAAGKKYLLAYICAPTEQEAPPSFNTLEAAEASRKDWAFVRIPFARDNEWIEKWGIKRVPCIVGGDPYANEFRTLPGNSNSVIRTIMKTIPPLVVKYEATLKRDMAKAKSSLERDRDRGIKALVGFLMAAKPGYPEVDEAAKLLREIGAEDLKQGELAESVGADKAIEYYEGLIKTYKTTPPGVQAEIRIARLEHAAGKSTAASLRLRKLEELGAPWIEPERQEASRVRSELSSK